jgi:hypothetical protein
MTREPRRSQRPSLDQARSTTLGYVSASTRAPPGRPAMRKASLRADDSARSTGRVMLVARSISVRCSLTRRFSRYLYLWFMNSVLLSQGRGRHLKQFSRRFLTSELFCKHPWSPIRRQHIPQSFSAVDTRRVYPALLPSIVKHRSRHIGPPPDDAHAAMILENRSFGGHHAPTQLGS